MLTEGRLLSSAGSVRVVQSRTISLIGAGRTAAGVVDSFVSSSRRKLNVNSASETGIAEQHDDAHDQHHEDQDICPLMAASPSERLLPPSVKEKNRPHGDASLSQHAWWQGVTIVGGSGITFFVVLSLLLVHVKVPKRTARFLRRLDMRPITASIPGRPTEAGGIVFVMYLILAICVGFFSLARFWFGNTQLISFAVPEEEEVGRVSEIRANFQVVAELGGYAGPCEVGEGRAFDLHRGNGVGRAGDEGGNGPEQGRRQENGRGSSDLRRVLEEGSVTSSEQEDEDDYGATTGRQRIRLSRESVSGEFRFEHIYRPGDADEGDLISEDSPPPRGPRKIHRGLLAEQQPSGTTEGKIGTNPYLCDPTIAVSISGFSPSPLSRPDGLLCERTAARTCRVYATCTACTLESDRKVIMELDIDSSSNVVLGGGSDPNTDSSSDYLCGLNKHVL